MVILSIAASGGAFYVLLTGLAKAGKFIGTKTADTIDGNISYLLQAKIADKTALVVVGFIIVAIFSIIYSIGLKEDIEVLKVIITFAATVGIIFLFDKHVSKKIPGKIKDIIGILLIFVFSVIALFFTSFCVYQLYLWWALHVCTQGIL